VRTRPKSKLRARVFMLAQGTVYSRVRHRKKQQFTVRTPFGSATAKGTDFVVTIAGDRFRVQTAAGVVETATDEGSVRVAAGQQTLAAADRPPAAPEQVSAEHLQAIEKALSQLGSPGGTEGLLAALVSLEDAVFAPLADLFSDVSGLANLPFATLKQGSAAARAQTAMQALIYALEMGDAEGTYPATLNPTTLEEISPSDEMRERILAQFRDKKLEYYKRTSSGYEVAARMLDENGTLIIARTGKVSIQKQEE